MRVSKTFFGRSIDCEGSVFPAQVLKAKFSPFFKILSCQTIEYRSLYRGVAPTTFFFLLLIFFFYIYIYIYTYISTRSAFWKTKKREEGDGGAEVGVLVCWETRTGARIVPFFLSFFFFCLFNYSAWAASER